MRCTVESVLVGLVCTDLHIGDSHDSVRRAPIVCEGSHVNASFQISLQATKHLSACMMVVLDALAPAPAPKFGEEGHFLRVY